MLAGGIVGGLLGAAGVAWVGTGYDYRPLGSPLPAVSQVAAGDSPGEPDLHASLQAMERRLAKLESQISRLAPRGKYIVVDRTHNKLYLREGRNTLLSAICSAGSGATLADPGSAQRWVFATPRGRFRVLSKIRNPVWRKPDWAFIEAGEAVPTDPRERFEYGALGEYALDFGDGYLIHGTLYERLLGRSVSHGCIRLGRDDLRALYAATRAGTPLYIY